MAEEYTTYRTGRTLGTTIYQNNDEQPCIWVPNSRTLAAQIVALLNGEAEARAQVTALRNVCAEAYQFAGAIGAPVAVLDNLSDASRGQALRHETFLPALPEDCAAVAALTQERDACLKITAEKINAGIERRAQDFMLKEPNRLITQDGRIAALEAELAAAKQERDAFGAAVDAVNALTPLASRIGPLHGAGIADGFRVAKDAMSAAMLAARAPEGTTATDSAGAIPLCEGCPPLGYPTDKTRCAECPLRAPEGTEGKGKDGEA